MEVRKGIAIGFWAVLVIWLAGLIYWLGHINGRMVGWDNHKEMLRSVESEEAELTPLSDIEFRLLQDIIRLQKRIDELEAKQDAGEAGEVQPEPAGELPAAVFREAKYLHRGYPQGAVRHTPAWLKPTRRLFLNSMIYHNEYYIDRASEAETDAEYDYALSQCLYWSIELTSGKEL